MPRITDIHPVYTSRVIYRSSRNKSLRSRLRLRTKDFLTEFCISICIFVPPRSHCCFDFFLCLEFECIFPRRSERKKEKTQKEKRSDLNMLICKRTISHMWMAIIKIVD